MKALKCFLRKWGIFCLILLLVVITGGTFLARSKKERNASEKALEPPIKVETVKKEKEDKMKDALEKGYHLPITESEERETEADCKRVMKLISGLYQGAEKGTASNVVISDHIIRQMQDKVKETMHPVTTAEVYANMENHEEMEHFLTDCRNGKNGSAVTYQIQSDGSIVRNKYSFDGTDLYVLTATTKWKEGNEPGIVHISYNRIKKWEYTDKGWFCYELCVPEPPEVTEIVDGSCMVRVRPIKEEYRELSRKYVLPIGYQGNNLLCSDWDTEHLEDLDYNGMYEYLYSMKYQKSLDAEECQNGIPKKEFEQVIMEYLQATSEQIEKYAVFDEENQVYKWEALGCFNYAPTFFGTAIPEVTGIKKEENGKVTLTVDAVCEMILCDDAVITHELTIQVLDNGSFRYLGNKILEDGLERIPDYQYRFGKEGQIYE